MHSTAETTIYATDTKTELIIDNTHTTVYKMVNNKLFQRLFAALLLIVACPLMLPAQTKMRDVFAAMPDSIIPYLTKNNRLDCIDFIEGNVKMEVENLFETKTLIEELTADYLKMRLNETTTLQMKMLTRQGCDTLICMIKTMKLPEEYSYMQLFDLKWNSVDSLNVLEKPFSTEGGVKLVSMSFSKDDDVLTIKKSELLTCDKDLAIPKEVLEWHYVWDGRRFVQR